MKEITFLTLIFLCLLNNIFSQEMLSKNDLEAFTHILEIKDGRLIGEGKPKLKEELQQTQYILLGEMHQSSQLGYFTSALLKEIVPMGFKHLALEVGPESARKLEELSAQPETTLENLSQFYKEYSNKTFQNYPIMFFQGIEDAFFLKTASELNVDLWGLDQEFYYANEFLLDELLSLKPENYNLKKAHNKAVARVKQLNRKSDLNKKFPRSCELLEGEEMNAFFKFYDSDNIKAQKIIRAIKKSLEIYCYNDVKEYRKCNNTRADYMYSNFMEKYNIAQTKGEKQPKVLIKLGNVHTTREESILGVEDMGMRITKLAKKNNTKSISITQLRRYIQKGNKIIDNIEKDWGKPFKAVFDLAKKDKWVLVDVRNAREKVAKGMLKTNKELSEFLISYDFILLSPADKRVTPNF